MMLSIVKQTSSSLLPYVVKETMILLSQYFLSVIPEVLEFSIFSSSMLRRCSYRILFRSERVGSVRSLVISFLSGHIIFKIFIFDRMDFHPVPIRFGDFIYFFKPIGYKVKYDRCFRVSEFRWNHKLTVLHEIVVKIKGYMHF